MTTAVPARALDDLRAELREMVDIQRAIGVLGWDQLTKMPAAGAAGRAESLATLQGILHERATSPRLGSLLSRAEEHVAGADPDGDEFNLVRVARRDYDRQSRIPAPLVTEMARTQALANATWEVARREADFAAFAPWLRKNIELSRQLAEHVGYAERPFDALVGEAEPGMTTATVQAIFDQLKPELVRLVDEIRPRMADLDDAPLHRLFEEATQERLCLDVAAKLGYDFARGRLDRTIHPFETSFGRHDVRITTRFDDHFLTMALMGTMHETGHALYEQGIGETLDRTTLDHGASAGMHESQSRLWENHVGRGLPFWRYYYPTVQAAFPQALGDVEVTAFHRAINKVHPSLIRVEADEITYCLHIMLRFELEIALFDGTLSVEDAPAAWNEAMRRYLGITPPSDRQGLLQDVHWTGGFGGFQGYALGNIIAAQVWESVRAAQPDLDDQLGRGNFTGLLDWLRRNIHQHGRKYDPADLVRRATGAPLSTEPYIRYLRTKFSQIYGL
jgi:carboxypeptidase Taq